MKPLDDDLDLENPLGLKDEPIAQDRDDQLPLDKDVSRRERTRALDEESIDRQSTGLGELDSDADDDTGIDMDYGDDERDFGSRR